MKVTNASGDDGFSVSNNITLPPIAEPERLSNEDLFQQLKESMQMCRLSDEDFYLELQSAVKAYGVRKMLTHLYVCIHIHICLFFSPLIFCCFQFTRI